MLYGVRYPDYLPDVKVDPCNDALGVAVGADVYLTMFLSAV